MGRELQLHPGLAIMAIYDEPIDPWKGATQGYHSLQYLEEHIKLEVLWSPPSVLAARLPGIGHDYQRYLLQYDRMAPFDVIIAAERSRGTVRARRGGLGSGHHLPLRRRRTWRSSSAASASSRTSAGRRARWASCPGSTACPS